MRCSEAKLELDLRVVALPRALFTPTALRRFILAHVWHLLSFLGPPTCLPHLFAIITRLQSAKPLIFTRSVRSSTVIPLESSPPTGKSAMTSRPTNASPSSSETLTEREEERDGNPAPLSKSLDSSALPAAKAGTALDQPHAAPPSKELPTQRQRGFSDLRQPVRGITAPPTTGRLMRALSGDYNLPDIADLKQRRHKSGLFHLVQRDSIHDAPHSNVKEAAEAEKDPDPNVITFEGDDDPLSAQVSSTAFSPLAIEMTVHPQNWSTRAKISQTLLLGISTLVVTFASSVFSSATSAVAAEFGIGSVTATLGTSLFVLGYAVGPLMCVTRRC